MNTDQTKIITPESPSIIIPGRPEPPPQVPQITFETLLNIFVGNLDSMCDDQETDSLKFEAKDPETGSPVFLHFSRGESALVIKKWIGKAEKRIRKKEPENETSTD